MFCTIPENRNITMGEVLLTMKGVIMKRVIVNVMFFLLFSLSVQSASAQTPYPEVLKKEIALYPKAEIVQTMDVSGTTMAMLKVSDKPDTIIKFYKKEMKDKGWKIVTEYNRENHVTVVGEKGAKNVMIDASVVQPGESLVNVTMTPK